MQRSIGLSGALVSLPRLSFVALALGSFGLGCSDPAPGPSVGAVTVGLTSEFRVPTDMVELHITSRVDGVVLREETRGVATGQKLLSFPSEVPFGALPDGAAVEVELSGFGGGGGVLFPVIKRLASTEVVGGRHLLMRVPLETECAPGLKSPVCDAPLTCVTGVCKDSHREPTSLETYSSLWSSPAGDICKPLNAGAPVVLVGKGQSDYFATDDGELSQVEAGPQGGHHIWVAIRMKNLNQSASITTIQGFVPDLNLELSPFSVIFTFDQDEGGYCKLFGLRYQLDTNGVDIKTVLGHQVKLTVTVTESKTGGVGKGERLVQLSDTIL